MDNQSILIVIRVPMSHKIQNQNCFIFSYKILFSPSAPASAQRFESSPGAVRRTIGGRSQREQSVVLRVSAAFAHAGQVSATVARGVAEQHVGICVAYIIIHKHIHVGPGV